jgi:hypothetical protein
MSRPTRYCLKCGEYVANDFIDGYGRYHEKAVLVHIDADGRIIHRAHAAVEDLR